MTTSFSILLLITLVAFLYASVGHGGASGYLALMVLFGISPVVMKSSALMLNIFVSLIAFLQYYSQGHFRIKILMPFILLSIPLSFIGARIHVDSHLYKIILSVCLFIATLRLLGIFGKKKDVPEREIPFVPAMFIGAIIGFISGMIGIGGGILLSPVLILLHWADMKKTAAVSAAFIFVNSVSGILGAAGNHMTFSPEIYGWTIAAILGGTAGSFYGSHQFSSVVLKYVLSVVLLFACTKLIIT
ncbi:MAG: sulfite exporter TauE/SafE family protein [Bacteroidetes bacterium]|nr:sulfite exporter TauE/SafE family protein [Bacteroidota bacterium]